MCVEPSKTNLRRWQTLLLGISRNPNAGVTWTKSCTILSLVTLVAVHLTLCRWRSGRSRRLLGGWWWWIGWINDHTSKLLSNPQTLIIRAKSSAVGGLSASLEFHHALRWWRLGWRNSWLLRRRWRCRRLCGRQSWFSCWRRRRRLCGRESWLLRRRRCRRLCGLASWLLRW